MTDLEKYTEKAAASLVAAQAAKTENDRAFHLRANAIYRRIIAGIGAAEMRAAAQPPAKPVRADTRPTRLLGR